MPNRGTSAIRVNGVDYRWAVSAARGFMIVVVQKSIGKGPKHRAVVNYEKIVTPSIVRQIVLDGLKKGWDPDRPEKASKKRGSTTRIEGLDQYASTGYCCPFCSKPEFRYRPSGSMTCGACKKWLDLWELYNFGGPLS